MKVFLNKFAAVIHCELAPIFLPQNYILKCFLFWVCCPFFLFADNLEVVQLAKEIEVRGQRVEGYRKEGKKRMDDALENAGNLEFKMRALIQESADLMRKLPLVATYKERSDAAKVQLKYIVDEWNGQIKEFCGTAEQIDKRDVHSNYDELVAAYLAKRKTALQLHSKVYKSRQSLSNLSISLAQYIKKLQLYVMEIDQWNLSVQQAQQNEGEISKEMEALQNRVQRLEYLAKEKEQNDEISITFKNSGAFYQRLVVEGKELQEHVETYHALSERLKKQLFELATPYEQVYMPQIEQAIQSSEMNSSEMGQNLEEMANGLSALILCYQPSIDKKASQKKTKQFSDETTESAKNSSFYVVCYLYIPQISKDPQAPLIKTSVFFVLKVEGEAESLYPESFFKPKKNLFIPIMLEGKDLQLGEIRRYEGGLLLEVIGVYFNLDTLKEIVGEFAETKKVDPFSYLVFETSDGQFNGLSHDGNVQLSWKGGPIYTGWTPAAREKSYHFFKQMLSL